MGNRILLFVMLLVVSGFAREFFAPDSLETDKSSRSSAVQSEQVPSPKIAPESSLPDDEDSSSRVELFPSFTVHPGDGTVALRWKNTHLIESDALFLERSTDDVVFTIIAEFPAELFGTPGKKMEFVDGSVRNGTTYFYRLVTLRSDGVVEIYKSVPATPGNPVPPVSEKFLPESD